MTTEQPAEAGEQPSKLAGGCVLAIGAVLAGGVAYAVPETAYYAAGLLTAAGVRRARTWTARRRGDEQHVAEDAVDIVAALHQLSPGGTQNVRLTQLQEATGLPDTRAVRALLDEANIRIKEVRTGGKVGQGVHATAIPRSCGAPSDSCWCAVTSNNNTNNTGGEGPEEGLRVEHIGAAGVVYHDPTERLRHHTTNH